MKKVIYWTPNSKKYLSLQYSLGADNVVTVHLLDGSIRKVNLSDCVNELQKQFKN